MESRYFLPRPTKKFSIQIRKKIKRRKRDHLVEQKKKKISSSSFRLVALFTFFFFFFLQPFAHRQFFCSINMLIFVLFNEDRIRWLLFLFVTFCFNCVLFFNKGTWINFIKTYSFRLFTFSLPTKQKLGKLKIFSIISLFHPPIIFYPLTFPHLQPNGA